MKKLKLDQKFCPVCNKELNYVQIIAKHSTCSKKCGHIFLGRKLFGKNSHFYRIGKVILNCKYCNNNFLVYPSANTRKYCSRICMGLDRRGKNNHNYKEFKPEFCVVCKKPLTKKLIIMKRKTCSYECGYINRDQRGNKNPMWKEVEQKFCLICDKELSHSRIISKRETCSLICSYKLASKREKAFYVSHPGFRAKENHPGWKNGISKLPYAFDFDRKLKDEIKKRNNYQCMLCRMPETEVLIRKHFIHHIDYNKLNSNPENLIALCSSCNSKVNFNREYWKNIFNKFSIERRKNVNIAYLSNISAR